MAASIKLIPTARGLFILYTGTLMSGMWAMIIPIVPVLTIYFNISAGTAAQIITALAVGRFVAMPFSGVVLDRLGTRAALLGGPVGGHRPRPPGSKRTSA
jgi:MFS family permease